MTTNTLSDNYQLTDEQIGDFWSQGFIVPKGVLPVERDETLETGH